MSPSTASALPEYGRHRSHLKRKPSVHTPLNFYFSKLHCARASIVVQSEVCQQSSRTAWLSTGMKHADRLPPASRPPTPNSKTICRYRNAVYTGSTTPTAPFWLPRASTFQLPARHFRYCTKSPRPVPGVPLRQERCRLRWRTQRHWWWSSRLQQWW